MKFYMSEYTPSRTRRVQIAVTKHSFLMITFAEQLQPQITVWQNHHMVEEYYSDHRSGYVLFPEVSEGNKK